LAAAQAPRAWLLKQAPAEEIAAAVQAVAHGLLVMDPAVARATRAAAPASRLRAVPTEELAEPLTERELEVLHLLALGLPNKAIALRLGISEHTVKFHVGAILAKMGAAGRTEAVMVAARRGILPL
jgi:DNA-binding NarL/FixJ family response regulator